MNGSMTSANFSSPSGNHNYNSSSRHSQSPQTLYSLDVLESQMRKIQVENSTLQTENKLLKEKYNRASVKITELESKLADSQDELVSVQESLNQELCDVKSKSQADTDWNTKQLQTQITTLTRSNDSLKSEVMYLEKQLEVESARKQADLANSDRSKVWEGHRIEISCLKDEIDHLKELLKQDEERLVEETARGKEARQQIIKLNEMTNLLQKQLETGGGGTAAQKQVNSLEKRLQVTEERLHQEHADRANNLSQVEEKLLSENAKLQALVKELTRQLQREKDKNRNLDVRIRDLKDNNEKLRLAVPLDESLITIGNNCDILYANQSYAKSETVSDMKFIMTQIEDNTGLSYSDEKEIICHLWNEQEKTQKKLRELEMHLQELELPDSNILQGLKDLRDLKNDHESKLKEMQEKIDDVRSEKTTFESQYQSQLSTLVKEKHEACARLKTLEDMMDAIRIENDILRRGLSSSPSSSMINIPANRDASEQVVKLTAVVKNLENKTSLLERKSNLLEIELDSVRTQLTAKEKQLDEVKSELLTASSRLTENKADNSKQEKIEKLSVEMSSLQSELKLMTEKCQDLLQEKSTLSQQLQEANRQLGVNRAKRKEVRMSHSTETKSNLLEMELDEKDQQLVKMTSQYHQTESELQHCKQELFYSQEHVSDLEGQIENLHQQFSQRVELWETIAAKEAEQLQQLNILKNSLDAAGRKYTHTQSELNVVKVELSRSQDRIQQLEHQFRGDERTEFESDLQQHEIEADRDRVKADLLQCLSEVKLLDEERNAVKEDLCKAKQDLLAEKSNVSRLSAEKVDSDHKLQDVSLERDALHREKSQMEEDLVKLERKLQEVLHKFELDARKQHSDFQSSHHADTADAKKLVSELNSLKLLLMCKDKDNEMLSDKLNRPNMEVNLLRRRVDMLRNENQYNKEDINRLTNELILKMKENSAVIEMSSHLVKEKGSLEKESCQLQRELQLEKDFSEKRKGDSADVIRKIEQAQQMSKGTAEELQQKRNVISSLEAELQQVKRALSQEELEKDQLKSKIKHLSEDVENLTSINTTLETRLDLERSSLAEERMNASQKKEDLTTTGYRLEALKHEQSMLLNNLSAERKTSEQLRMEVSRQEQLVQQFTLDMNTSQQDLDTQRAQIENLQGQIEQMKKEKSYLYQDYEGMCRKLSEKDRVIAELKESYDSKIEVIKKDIQLQQSERDDDSKSLEKDLKLAQDEIVDLNEQLKKKELQLTSYCRALHEIQELTMHNKEMESKVSKMEWRLAESQILLESHRKEMMSYKEINQKLQDELGSSQVTCHSLQEELRTQKGITGCQALEFNHKLTDLQAQKDTETFRLKDALNLAEQKLQSTQQTLEAVQTKTEQLHTDNRLLARSLDQIKTQHAEECTARKLAQQKLQSAICDVDDVRKQKLKCEERILELQTRLSSVDPQLKTETDRVWTLSAQLQECKMMSQSQQTTIKTQQENINTLQSEVSQLQTALEAEKQLLEVRLQKTTLDLRQKIESAEEHQQKLTQQVQLLSVNLEQMREQVASKNKENLKLSVELLDLQEELQNNCNKLRQASDSLRVETEMQSKLNTRFEEQEEELKRLKGFLAKKCDQEADGDNKGMWQEMDKMVKELSQQMQKHLESQKLTEENAKDRESKLSTKYRKQINQLESEISTERALHNITKSSLQAIEEDTSRLQAQVHAMRHYSHTPEPTQKSRIEAINELIARSQIRAQQMLPTGMYSTAFNSTYSNPHYNTSLHLDGSHTPDDASQISNGSLGHNSSVYLAMLNTSGTFPSDGSETPRK